MSGDWAAVGDLSKATVHMYRRAESGWEYVHSIRGPRSTYFASTIDLSGDTMVVGVPLMGFPIFDHGEVWVYERSGDQWVQTHALVAHELDVMSQVGRRVAISGDVIAVGAPGFVQGAPHPWAGAVVIFDRNGSGWDRTVLPWSPCCPSLPNSEMSGMGFTIAVDGETVIAGGPGEEGMAYVFGRDSGGTWRRTGVLTDPTPFTNGGFGGAVAVRGNLAVIGRPRTAMSGFGYSAGSALVFERSSITAPWQFMQELQASDGHGGFDYGDQFGLQVSISGGRVAVSAAKHNGLENLDGKIYLFEENRNGAWEETRSFTSPMSQFENGLGVSLGLSREYVIAGRVNSNSPNGPTVYAWELPVGEDFCFGGGRNTLSVIGTTSLSGGTASLVASNLEVGTLSIFLLGTRRTQIPMLGGTLCVGLGAQRVGSLQVASDSEKVIHRIDFHSPPLVGHSFVGSTLLFQHWADFPGATPELSNAISLRLAQ